MHNLVHILPEVFLGVTHNNMEPHLDTDLDPCIVRLLPYSADYCFGASQNVVHLFDVSEVLCGVTSVQEHDWRRTTESCYQKSSWTCIKSC